jgi:hypothetical protein
MELEVDRLSSVPKIILHDIMSMLLEKDAARTSVLSKSWLETWYTFPMLSFSDTKIVKTLPQPKENLTRTRKYFIDCVNKSLLRFYVRRLAIKEFKLSVRCFELRYMSKDVDFWLMLASESCVEILELILPIQGECYVLPKGVIEVKSLSKLLLNGRIRIDQTFMNLSTRLFLLRELYLYVPFGDEQAIEHLISCCPLIECITLHFFLVPPSSSITWFKKKTCL